MSRLLDAGGWLGPYVELDAARLEELLLGVLDRALGGLRHLLDQRPELVGDHGQGHDDDQRNDKANPRRKKHRENNS